MCSPVNSRELLTVHKVSHESHSLQEWGLKLNCSFISADETAYKNLSKLKLKQSESGKENPEISPVSQKQTAQKLLVFWLIWFKMCKIEAFTYILPFCFPELSLPAWEDILVLTGLKLVREKNCMDVVAPVARDSYPRSSQPYPIGLTSGG